MELFNVIAFVVTILGVLALSYFLYKRSDITSIRYIQNERMERLYILYTTTRQMCKMLNYTNNKFEREILKTYIYSFISMAETVINENDVYPPFSARQLRKIRIMHDKIESFITNVD